jgi:hypothetical protein
MFNGNSVILDQKYFTICAIYPLFSPWSARYFFGALQRLEARWQHVLQGRMTVMRAVCRF